MKSLKYPSKGVKRFWKWRQTRFPRDQLQVLQLTGLPDHHLLRRWRARKKGGGFHEGVSIKSTSQSTRSGITQFSRNTEEIKGLMSLRWEKVMIKLLSSDILKTLLFDARNWKNVSLTSGSQESELKHHVNKKSCCDSPDYSTTPSCSLREKHSFSK
jgi:hypothetical protein